MPEHFTRNTVSAEFYCAKCERRTQHRIDDTRKGPCLDCIAHLEEVHTNSGERLNVIVCRDRNKVKWCLCGYQAVFLCDWKAPEKSSGTCDKPICAKHAKEVSPGKHLCPFHQVQYESWKRRHPEKVATVEVGVQTNLFESGGAL
jgi:hypothetical protein